MSSTALPSQLEQELRDMNEALLLSSISQHELTEQAQHAEATARRSEERYRTLFDLCPVAVYSCDAAGVIQEFNSRAAELWGRAPALGDTDERFCGSFKMFRPDGSFMPHARCPMAEVVSGKIPEVRNTEVIIERPDGSRVPVIVNIRPLSNERGKVTGAINCFYDITERKQDEAARARLAAVVEGSADAIISKDLNGIITSWNKGAQRLFGYTAEEMIGKPMTVLIPSDRAAEEAGILERIRRGERIEQFDTVRQRKQGSLVNISLTVSPIRAANGRIIGAAKIARDITERKRAEAALYESELRYRGLFETTRDGILILDATDGTIIDANPSMSEVLGYAHDEFLGKELWEIGLFSDRSASMAAVRELQQKGFIRYEHLPLATKRGGRVEVEVVASADRGVLQCNIRDITERLRLERKTQEQAAVLVDLHRRKDEFLAMLSHELRNPLASIANAARLLDPQAAATAPIQQRAHSIIERQVWQLTHLVDDSLEVSRITTGRIQLHQEQIAVTGIVERAVETVRPLIQQRRHELTLALPEQPVWLHADASRLEQVVVNLLTNAAKYTDEGGRIALTVQEDGGAAVLRVRDTGVGIAPELLPHIFDLFTQAERSLDRSQGGLGIGLCLVQRLVELHGGTVEVSSILGEGSEFIVRLPVMRPSAPLPPAIPTDAAQPTASLRVLAVDDSVDTAESLVLLLKASGHEVRTARDGPTALEAALDYRPDVVLLDIGLPGLDGFEVAKWIRRQPALETVVLVALTGYGRASDRQRSQEAGFDYHVVKPADLKELQNILTSVAAGNVRRALPPTGATGTSGSPG